MDDGDSTWFAVYGDSLSRGMFFDTVAALNGSTSPSLDKVHEGHNANYSVDCTIWDTRPPLRRPKCGGFAFDWSSARGQAARVRAVQPANGNDASPPWQQRSVDAQPTVRLSFRLKTFAWEAQYDEPWLNALRTARRLPDALLLSFGIWDMQYPPGNEPVKGVDAFVINLRHFMSALERALRANKSGGPRPRIYWLSVTAVSDARLPAWKRPRMSASLSRRYNELAQPVLRRHGIQYVDTHSVGAAHPELSRDGVHFEGVVARQHTHLFWEGLCGGQT